VAALRFVGRAQSAEGRPADECASDRREAPPRGLPRAVGPAHLRADDSCARVRVGEVDEGRDRSRLRDRVRVDVQDVLARGRADSEIDVRRKGKRARVLEDANAVRSLPHGTFRVGDDDRLVDLREERRQEPLDIRRVTV
jgi:hypothetical protein